MNNLNLPHQNVDAAGFAAMNSRPAGTRFRTDENPVFNTFQNTLFYLAVLIYFGMSVANLTA